MTGLLLAWAVEAGVVTWRAVKIEQRAPLPSEFAATFVVFGVLGAISEIPSARTTASVAAWGIVLATALNLGAAQTFSPQPHAAPSAAD